MEEFNVGPTAEVVERAALVAQELHNRLTHIAAQMRKKNDVSYATEALTEILNLPNAARCDLLVTRPIREFQVREMSAERKGN